MQAASVLTTMTSYVMRERKMEHDTVSSDDSMWEESIGSESGEKDEIRISLVRGGQVMSSFKFEDLARLAGTPSLSFMFTLADLMQWSEDKLREALIFYQDVYRMIGESVKMRTRYSVEHLLTDKVKYGELNDVRLILDVFKDDINTEIPFGCGETVLGHAMTLDMPQNLDIPTTLIDMGADVNHCNSLGYEILDTAMQHCQVDCVQLLLMRGARGHRCDTARDIDVHGPHRPLVICSMINNVELAEVLICAGASMDARRYDPLFTPMRAALMKRAFGVVELLLKCGYNLSLESFIFPTSEEALSWTPPVLLEESGYLNRLLEASYTPVTLKRQVRGFLWKLLNKNGIPIHLVSDMNIPTAFVAYMTRPSMEP